MSRARRWVVFAFVGLGIVGVPAPASADQVEDVLNLITYCNANPARCVPLTGDNVEETIATFNDGTITAPEPEELETDVDSLEIPGIQAGFVAATDRYRWTYDSGVKRLMLCKVNGFGVVTDCRVVARFKAFAKINLNGRQSQWTQWSEHWDGPALRASHGWKCIDDNGSLPNSSCQDLMHRKNSVYTTGRYTAPDPYNNYHEDDELYWYKFHYHFEISGYSGKWRWPNGGEFDSAKFECLDAFEPSPCRF